MPTEWGTFTMIAYADQQADRMPHLALVHADYESGNPVVLRVHSECMTGDVFHSRRCDCGAQLDKSMEMAAQQGGVVIYLRQEGRGIGLISKLDAYQLQDQGLDTAEANTHLGFPIDDRQYADAITIMEDLGITEIRLLTNNPEKVEAFADTTVKVVERLPLIIKPNADNQRYLKTKKKSMGHLF